MSEIDWSEAKPGYDIHIDWGDRSHFYQIVGDRYVRENGYYAVISEVEGMDGVVVTVRPSAWSGDGLPPVGTVCEALWNQPRDEWLKVKIFGVNEHGQPIHRWEEGIKKYQYQASPLRGPSGIKYFRPIRTPEQIAAEERNKAIRAIELHILKAQEQYLSVVQTAQSIYDAGFQVPKP